MRRIRKDCPADFSCVAEQVAYYYVEGVPNGERRRARTFYPGGICSPVPRLEYGTLGACDPFAAIGEQGCGACGACGGVNFDTGFLVACEEACTPSLTSTGCSRPGYTCGLASHSCHDGCVSDLDCKFKAVDTDADGLADLNQYQETSASYCDEVTLRCRNPGKGGAQAGDPCDDIRDCEQDGFCYTPDDGYGGTFAGGYCSKEGCDLPGFECAVDAVCVRLRSISEYPNAGHQCMKPCTQGKESASLQVGSGGHGDTCRTGYMCLWSGNADDPSRVCVPGHYNDVMENNVGAYCTRPSECYSPMGLGTCLAFGVGAVGHQMCTIRDCDAAGLANGVCGPNADCVLLEDGRQTACLLRCDEASQCESGLGCVDVDPHPTMFFGVCYYRCKADTECRTGEVCRAGVCGAA